MLPPRHRARPTVIAPAHRAQGWSMVYRDVLEDGMRYGGVKLAKPYDYSAKPPSPQIDCRFGQGDCMKDGSCK